MAGDWIKVEICTPDKPEVYQIAEILGIDPELVFAKLFRVWSWFDTHTIEGNAGSVSKMLINRVAGVTDFSDAMIAAGWMKEEEGKITLPNFGDHNGKTAKNRAVTAKRVAKHKSKSNDKGNGGSVSKPLASALPREEKRREENNIEQKPLWLDEFYEQAWKFYPKKVDKKKSMERLKKLINKEEHKELAETIAQHIQHKAQITAKEYWPTLDRFLRDEKWNDEVIDYEANRAANNRANNQPMSAVERVAAANGLNPDGTQINPGPYQAIVVKDDLDLWP